MIPSIRELTRQSQFEANQNEKQAFKMKRQKALDYYNGRTTKYTNSYFNFTHQVPIANVNVTKRVIDRTSLVYMVEPKRDYSKPEITDFMYYKHQKLQRAERYTNLLDSILLKITWRNDRLEYDVVHDFEPMFGDDPLHPIGYSYPLSIKSEVLDDTPEMFQYWDMENQFVFDRNGKIMPDEDNPDHVNFYGDLPFVELFREGRPEYAYLDTDPATDLIDTNTLINVAETNKSANIHFQSFGYAYVTGSDIDKNSLKVGQDQMMYLGQDGAMSIVAPPNSIPALTEGIKESYKMLAQNYHLPTSFADGTAAESGTALRLRNQELSDNKKSDIDKFKDCEYKIFEVEKLILLHEMMIDAGELEMVDFNETAEVLSTQEQLDKWEWMLGKGLIDEADILMKMNPDGFSDRDEAFAYIEERNKVAEQVATSPLIEALTKPV
tara:strand:+ start:595 stop:1908 length:1314 start_codon:yes stop_codon:yes gene_type:complete